MRDPWLSYPTADDLEELCRMEFERRRMERDNELCGYTPDRSAAGENEAEV